MSTITDSLKNFYKKLGGSLSNLGPNSTSADIVDAMAEVYTDKEGTYVEVTEEVTEGTKIVTIKTNNVDHDIYAPVELPTVTSEDEGKVLSVDSNGDWAAGSSNVLIIRAAITSLFGYNWINFTKTIGEINTDIRNACTTKTLTDVIIICGNKKNDFMMFRCSQINSTSIDFCNILRLPTSTQYIYFSIPTTGTETYVTYTEITVNDPA